MNYLVIANYVLPSDHPISMSFYELPLITLHFFDPLDTLPAFLILRWVFENWLAKVVVRE